ncbi:transportin-3 isoform X2 [Orussus abietinus]|uniref:transportin-3 isoform X2 n=1 Tax=Orussus abietinus TaxID=222816 RepID=UPI0006252D0E|nr:transportin-3 isoform X2 [Orussus abietinus]
MESPPDLETVYQAVYSLYNNPDTSEKEKASLWLGELQGSVFAWKVADEMLQHKRDLESCYFAAQTMRTKIQMSFHELPVEAHTSLRDSLMDHLSQINENTNGVIVTQLCLALADLGLQMSSWQKPVVDLINRFGGISSSLWPLLEVMRVLPEEVNSPSLRLGANRRQHIMMDLADSADTVTEFLKMCLKNSGDNVQIIVRILRCFTSWIGVPAVPLPNSDIVAYAFQVLGNHMAGSQIHEAATDCVCVILQVLEDVNINDHSQNNSDHILPHLQHLQLCLFTCVMALEQPYHLSVAHEDMEKNGNCCYRSANYCRIFTELAETFLRTMVDGCVEGKQHYAIKILDLVLTCVGHHDYEVAEITFNLWYRLSEVLYQRNNDELNSVFKPHIERLIGALCRHCQMEPDHLGLVEEGGGGEEFAEFRMKVSELIKDVVFVVSSSHCFRQMFSNLTGGPGPQGQPAHPPTWDSTEAALFVMQAVAKNILPEENDVVPKVVEAILNLPEGTHIAVRHTSILLLGELCEWIERHPQSLEPVLNFLLACLNQRGLGNAASSALQSICAACSQHMAAHFPGLLQIARSLDSFGISNDAAIGLLRGVSIILARLPREEIGPAMKELCWFQARPLCELLESRGNQSDPVIWLDRLAAIFRHTNPSKEESNEPHPCQSVITEMWPVLSKTCTTYQRDARLMERCCRCLRFAVRCVGKHSAHLLEPLVKQIVELYAAHQHSCFLYLGSVLVDEYASDMECVSGLLGMLEAFIGPAFALLQNPDGLKNHPDTVDDLFRLCARFLQRSPVAFLHSGALSSIVDCALLACSLDHRDANASVMKFFYDLVHSGRNHDNRSDFTIRRQLVQNIMREKGQTLVARLLHASVFSLHTYMLSDVADVVIEMTLFDKELLSKWLEEAIKAMPTQNAGGLPTATPEQLLEFHSTVLRAETSKIVTHALRDFARLFR